MTTALETIREDQALGAAWRRCEAALPEGYGEVRFGLTQPPVGETYPDPYWAEGWFVALPSTDGIRAEGPTPTAALLALADKLEALR